MSFFKKILGKREIKVYENRKIEKERFHGSDKRVDELITKGKQYFAQKRFEESLIFFDQALSLDPKNAYIWNEKAFTLDHLKRHNESLKAYEQAILLSPEFALAWFNKCIPLFALQQNNEALVAANRALDLNYKDTAAAWVAKSVALGNLYRYNEALSAVNQALILDPGNSTYQKLKQNITDAIINK